ncbi:MULTISPECIES: hypothetical protein [Marinobacter]|uniref:Uncharacterized protein n=1 Tax=Marinobacter suaedae TaxID=3057675 RepID=A0ABT8VWX4_9GAMM|nr:MULTISPECIES: hypothetical protein [unclassified Marinobacter]MBZ2168592.1 hypothetical protein [Marinobacter sp. F4216]MDO3720489.1 hypothetical protein [Marinobacter sp. chi1]
MDTPSRPSQADVLNKLYCMKQKQLAKALESGNSLRSQVLAAEAEAIFNAIKTAR